MKRTQSPPPPSNTGTNYTEKYGKFGPSYGAFPKDIWTLIICNVPLIYLTKFYPINKSIYQISKAAYLSKYKRRTNNWSSARAQITTSPELGTIDAMVFWKHRRFIIRGARTDTRASKVVLLDQDGTELFNFFKMEKDSKGAEYLYFHDMCPVGDNMLLVCCSTKNKLILLEQKGKLKWSPKMTYTADLNGPWGCCVDSRDPDHIYVADTCNHCVKVISFKEGKLLRTIGGGGELRYPVRVLINKANELVVVDQGNHCIKTFTKEGALLRTFGKHGSQDGQFNVPDGIDEDGDGRLYIADVRNNRIQIFGADGRFFHSLRCPVPGITRIVKMDWKGTLHVANNRSVTLY